MIKASQFLLTN